MFIYGYIGLDTIYNVLKGWNELPQAKNSTQAYPIIPDCLEKLYENGEFGRKSGKGFYTWDGDKVGAPREL